MKIDKSKWTKVTFGDIATESRDTIRDYEGKSLARYIGLDHIVPENLSISRWGELAEGVSFTKTFIGGDILFGRRRAYQKKAAIAPFDGVCSGDILVFRPKVGQVDPTLFPFLIQNDRFFDFAMKTSAGSLSPRTKFKDLSRFELLLPPLGQQKEFADLLWSGEMMRQRYIQFLNIHKLFFKSSLNSLISKPDGIYRLHDRVQCIKGITYTSSDYGDKTNGECLISLNCFEKFGGFKQDGIKWYKGEFIEKNMLEKGDLIIAATDITREGDVVGYPVFVPDLGKTTLYTMDVVKLDIVKKDEIDPHFLYYLLRTNWAHWHMFAYASGTTVLHLDLKALPKLKFPNYPLEKQRKIAKELSAIEAIIDMANCQLTTCENLKKSFIDEIFT